MDLDFANVEPAKECPICGKRDSLSFTKPGSFYKINSEEGHAAIRVSCHRCNIDLWEHTYQIANYAVRFGMLIDKWNKMPRREREEIEDDGK